MERLFIQLSDDTFEVLCPIFSQRIFFLKCKSHVTVLRFTANQKRCQLFCIFRFDIIGLVDWCGWIEQNSKLTKHLNKQLCHTFKWYKYNSYKTMKTKFIVWIKLTSKMKNRNSYLQTVFMNTDLTARQLNLNMHYLCPRMRPSPIGFFGWTGKNWLALATFRPIQAWIQR